MQQAETIENLADHFNISEALPTDAMSITYNKLMQHQKDDSHLKELLRYSDPIVKPMKFHGGGNVFQLYTNKGKIYIPKSLQHQTIKWYHDMLCPPGQKRMEETIGQHFW